jgi:SAM-dependent methyltransferase
MLRQCPICRRRLLRFAPRPGVGDRAVCPGCGSRQRHRHLWLWLERHTDLLRAPLDVLHVAPEPGMEARLRGAGTLRSYVTADLSGEGVDRVVDLTAIDLPDSSLDVLLANHVLEHVADDRQAFREVARVLRPGGWAVLQVPILGPVTIEEAPGDDPAERLARFGQDDHVRTYGNDFPDRLRDGGLVPEPVLFRDELSAAERRRFGLSYDLTDLYGVDFDELPEAWTVWRVRPAG